MTDFEANSFQAFIVNGLGWNGRSAIPMSDVFTAPTQTNFVYDFTYHYAHGSQSSAAPALVILEDGQGDISAIFVCPPSYFPNSTAG
jgi:hypothetical protein